MGEDISINTSTCRRFLKGTGLNASKDGIAEFEKVLVAKGNALAEKAAEFAKEAKRKTIMDEDITAASSSI